MFTLIALILIIALLASSSSQAAQIRRLQKTTGTAPESVRLGRALVAALVLLGILVAASW